jgi:hypothetical protein
VGECARFTQVDFDRGARLDEIAMNVSKRDCPQTR